MTVGFKGSGLDFTQTNLLLTEVEASTHLEFEEVFSWIKQFVWSHKSDLEVDDLLAGAIFGRVSAPWRRLQGVDHSLFPVNM